MGGEICPEMEFNPPLQLGTRGLLKCLFPTMFVILLAVTMTYVKHIGHATAVFRTK